LELKKKTAVHKSRKAHGFVALAVVNVSHDDRHFETIKRHLKVQEHHEALVYLTGPVILDDFIKIIPKS
jgi:ribosome-interacting GTPase 1